MYRLNRITNGLAAAADAFEPRGRAFAAGRSLLALATLSVLVFTPTRGLFVYTPDNPSGARCGGVRMISLWCAGGHGHTVLTVRLIVSIVVLAAVVAGFSPRWTCVPHWYVTFSLGTTMTLPNGGDSVARIAAMLMIPMCLGDDRRWHWQRPARPLPPRWRGAAYAAHLFVRLQVTIIYVSAAVAKLTVGSWRDGSYLYQVLHDPYYGPPSYARPVVGAVLDAPPLVRALTWGTIAVELAIAVSMAGGPRVRRVALVLAIALHGSIIVMLGLASFGLIMIALLALASVHGVAAATRPAEPVGGAEPVRLSAQLPE
jgi:antimicrobial peptide system SdpB family protein